MTDQTNTSDRLDAAVIIGLLIILGGVMAALVFVQIPEKNATLFAALAGTVVGAGLMAFINNRWGSSKSGTAKDATIASMLPKGDGQ